MSEDCAVCTDECEEVLTCGHNVHWQCVARSGRASCPVCRAQLQIPEQWTLLFRESQTAVSEELARRATTESENLARQLQNIEVQGGTNRRYIRTPVGRTLVVRVQETNGPVSIDELMSGIARLQHDVVEGRRTTESTASAVDMVTLLWTLNEISAETGLSTASLIEALGILAEN